MFGVTVKFIPKEEKPRTMWNLDTGDIVALVHADEPIGKGWEAVDSMKMSRESYRAGVREPRPQGPKTFAGYIAELVEVPNDGRLEELSGALFPSTQMNSKHFLDCVKAYNLGRIHGKQEERARKKAHDAEQGQS